MSDSIIPELLNEVQAAGKLGISLDTIRRARGNGKIAYTYVGKRVRYREQDLVDYLNSGRQNARLDHE